MLPMGKILAPQNCDQELIKDMWRYPATKMLVSQHSEATLGIREGACITGHGPKGNASQAGQTSCGVSGCRDQIWVSRSKQKGKELMFQPNGKLNIWEQLVG